MRGGRKKGILQPRFSVSQPAFISADDRPPGTRWGTDQPLVLRERVRFTFQGDRYGSTHERHHQAARK